MCCVCWAVSAFLLCLLRAFARLCVCVCVRWVVCVCVLVVLVACLCREDNCVCVRALGCVCVLVVFAACFCRSVRHEVQEAQADINGVRASLQNMVREAHAGQVVNNFLQLLKFVNDLPFTLFIVFREERAALAQSPFMF